jgi:hypothetical protein
LTLHDGGGPFNSFEWNSFLNNLLVLVKDFVGSEFDKILFR